MHCHRTFFVCFWYCIWFIHTCHENISSDWNCHLCFLFFLFSIVFLLYWKVEVSKNDWNMSDLDFYQTILKSAFVSLIFVFTFEDINYADTLASCHYKCTRVMVTRLKEVAAKKLALKMNKVKFELMKINSYY